MNEKLIQPTLKGLLLMSCILLLGIFIPVVISLIASISESITFEECVSSVMFWIFTLLFSFCASIYLDHMNVNKIK